MATRMIDRNAHRFGAGISAVILALAFVLQWHGAVLAMAVVLAVGPLFGLKASPLGATYRFLKRTLKLEIPVEHEEEAPPRFAQLVGFLFLGAASLSFWAFSAEAVGWALTLVVAALQTLLAASGICVGCEVYNVGRRLSRSATS